jgi:hypothetical protein
MLYENKISEKEKEKVIDVSNRLGIDPDWLMLVMNSESGINAQAVNKQTGDSSDPYTRSANRATGLIQFMPLTAKGLGTTTQKLFKMSMVDQLEYVYKYFKPKAYDYTSFHDLYLYTFFPIAVGQPDGWILQAKGIAAESIYNQNPAIAKFSTLPNKIDTTAFKKYTEDKLTKAGVQLPSKKVLETTEVVINKVKKNKFKILLGVTVLIAGITTLIIYFSNKD